MSEEALKALAEKRAALIVQIKDLQSRVFHIDGAVIALGGRMPMRTNRLFAHGELMRLIGDAERTGLNTARDITQYIIKAKRLDAEDAGLFRRLRIGVTECLKRMAARGV
jgi:hypothetical protein